MAGSTQATNRKLAVVTGGTGALGAAVAQQLSDSGYEVHVTTSRELAPPGYQGPGRAHVVDLANLDSLRALARTFERVDALVISAGAFAGVPLDDMTSRDLDAMFDVNARTAANTLAAFGRKMARGSGVVLVGSQAYAGAANIALYAASKAAVVSLAKSAALEWKSRGVRVNAVLPDTIDTAANRRAMPDADTSRWATPQAIADTIAWLCGGRASVVSGNAISIGV
jgi:NAD(P)-dependent dehydrogenase (short-subunit alcohol dehydrogenase family)